MRAAVESRICTSVLTVSPGACCCNILLTPAAESDEKLDASDDRFEDMVEVVAVDTLDEVMQYALIKHEQKAGLVERLEAVIDRLTPEVQSKISLV